MILYVEIVEGPSKGDVTYIHEEFDNYAFDFIKTNSGEYEKFLSSKYRRISKEVYEERKNSSK